MLWMSIANGLTTIIKENFPISPIWEEMYVVELENHGTVHERNYRKA